LRPVQQTVPDPIPKITITKWTGEVAQVVEHLYKLKTMNSNPSSSKKTKNGDRLRV
jgi:hypothetical protein